jgi:hypothetical protein
LTLEISTLPAEPEALPGPRPLFRRRLGRVFGRCLAGINNAFFPTPLGRWLHQRLLRQLDVRELDVPLPGPAARIEWPTIAFLSDLHAGHYMTARDLVHLAEALARLRPDLVCLGGDLVNHREEELEHLWPALALLRPPLGIYAVPGNHDYVVPGTLGGWPAALEAHGVRVLVNRGLRLQHRGHALWLCGVDDLTDGEPRLAEALAGRRGEPTLLLSHHPDLFREASARSVDLQLSGHTHAGQIRVLGHAPLHHSRFGYVEGVYERGASRLFVGRGAGVTALPLRIGTRSEITLLRPHGA